jgi:hypothetical protein
MSDLNALIVASEGDDMTRSSTNTAIQIGEPSGAILWKRHWSEAEASNPI